MRVTLEKLPGVEAVTVRLNEGRATIALEPGNTITMPQVRRSIVRNGFTPREAIVRGEADVVAKDDALEITVAGTTDTYGIADTSHVDAVQQLRKYVGQRVSIEGTVPAPKDPKAAPVMQVASVKRPGQASRGGARRPARR